MLVITNYNFKKFDTTRNDYDWSFESIGHFLLPRIPGKQVYLIDRKNTRYIREISWENGKYFFRDLVVTETIPNPNLPESMQEILNKDFTIDPEESFFEKIYFKPDRKLNQLLNEIKANSPMVL